MVPDNFDISGIHSVERTLMLDISAIPITEDVGFDEDQLFQQLTVLGESSTTNHLLQAACLLKKKVIQTLENYKKLISQNDRTIREIIPKDITQIQQEYQSLLEMCEKAGPVDKEVLAITKLVGEFITKMGVRSTTKAKTQPPPQLNTQSYESDESTQQSTIFALNNKIKDLLSKVSPEYSKIIELSSEILNNSDIPDQTFKHLRAESKTVKDDKVHKLVKACYLKILMQQEQSHNTSKREFYDLVIKLKSQAPSNHQAHQAMISSLYEDVLQQGVPSGEWESYMKKKLQI